MAGEDAVAIVLGTSPPMKEGLIGEVLPFDQPHFEGRAKR